MTEEDKKLLNIFEIKLRHFMYLHDELRHENAKLKQLLAEKNDEVRQLKNSRKELEVMYTNLKMARTISIHDKDISDTKQRLSRLVREVDKCIALLNE
ncbi:hypothetical protein [uncultured Phocaeicola sp.]|uniref:hypothetical protein n=1 Tax=uncultured Phocaeicola sp. TaxID=990718 RepID=UPI001558E118|nr:hypothetical protein [uncultured Phocaeicola sp.]MDE6800022.1 hypothetical protein [Phocaeicola sp.]